MVDFKNFIKFGNRYWIVLELMYTEIKKRITYAAYVLLYGIGVYESFLAVLQLFRFLPSGNPMFAFTGTFQNPGPLGGFLAVVASIAISEIIELHNSKDEGRLLKFRIIASELTLFYCILVLPASLSRAGWLAFSAAVIVCLLRNERVKSWMRGKKGIVTASSVAFVLLCIGAFFLKKESAIGRFHIWGIELRAIAHNPLTGTGVGSFMHTYGVEQAEFFESGVRSLTFIRVAGCPEYPFNEFLGIGVEFGAVAMIAALAIVLVGISLLLRMSSTLAYGLIAWTVFACFSYPLNTELLRLALLVLLFFAYLPRGLKPVSHLFLFFGVSALVAVFFIQSPKERPSFRPLFQEGLELYDYGDYRESLEVLEEGASISCDPMFHVIMGRDYEALGECEHAEKEYLMAHYMVPCRLYPLVRLMKMYISQGRNEEAIFVGERIVQMEVRQNHVSMERLMQETVSSLDSLKTCFLPLPCMDSN